MVEAKNKRSFGGGWLEGADLRKPSLGSDVYDPINFLNPRSNLFALSSELRLFT